VCVPAFDASNRSDDSVDFSEKFPKALEPLDAPNVQTDNSSCDSSLALLNFSRISRLQSEYTAQDEKSDDLETREAREKLT